MVTGNRSSNYYEFVHMRDFLNQYNKVAAAKCHPVLIALVYKLLLPKAARYLPKAALDLPKAVQDPPKAALDLPKAAQDLPKAAQDLPKHENPRQAQFGTPGSHDRHTLAVKTKVFWRRAAPLRQLIGRYTAARTTRYSGAAHSIPLETAIYTKGYSVLAIVRCLRIDTPMGGARSFRERVAGGEP